jgi:hypothetical protein
MMRALVRTLFLIVLIAAFAAIAVPQPQPLSVIITSPRDNAAVPWRPCVAGRVSDPAAKLYLVINDKSGNYYVQPGPVSVKADGSWTARPYVAENKPGVFDGLPFELKALANPKAALEEGQVLAAWPEAEASSDLIDITRRDEAAANCSEGHADLRAVPTAPAANDGRAVKASLEVTGRRSPGSIVEISESTFVILIALAFVLFCAMAALPHRAQAGVHWLMGWCVTFARGVWFSFPRGWAWLSAYSRGLWTWCHDHIARNWSLRGYQGDHKGFALHMLRWPLLALLILPGLYTDAYAIRGGLTLILPTGLSDDAHTDRGGLLVTKPSGSMPPPLPAVTAAEPRATSSYSGALAAAIEKVQDWWRRDRFLFMALGLSGLEAVFGMILLWGLGEQELLRLSPLALCRVHPMPMIFFVLLDFSMTLLAANRGFEYSPDTVGWAMPVTIAALIAFAMPWLLAYGLHFVMESFSACWGPLQALVIGVLVFVGGALGELGGVLALVVRQLLWVCGLAGFGLISVIAILFLLFAIAVGELIRLLFSGLNRPRGLRELPA